MASYTIPEEVIGVPLFVPDGNDYFTIEAAGMPNGDDALRCRGDLGKFRAFQPAPVTSPNISANGTEWSLNFWINAPATGTGGNGGSGDMNKAVIMGIMNSQVSSATANPNALWTLTQASAAGRVIFNRGVTNTVAGAFVADAVGARDSTWHMVTIMVPDTASTGYAYIDEDVAPTGSDTQTSAGAPASDLFLCIGPYASDAVITHFAQDFQLGKISFHDHHLNQTERSMLYQSMTA